LGLFPGKYFSFVVSVPVFKLDKHVYVNALLIARNIYHIYIHKRKMYFVEIILEMKLQSTRGTGKRSGIMK